MQDLNDKENGGSLSPAEWNQMPTELQNIIITMGITLSALDLDQLAQAIVTYAATSDFYDETSASSTAYILGTFGTKQGPDTLTGIVHNGLRVRWRAETTNTAAATVDVNGVGVKVITREDGTALVAGDIAVGEISVLEYDQAASEFLLLNPRAPIALANSATPSVASGKKFLTGGTTTITDLTGGHTGKVIYIVSEHAITITDNANLILSSNASFIMAATDTLTLIQKVDGNWYELARSVSSADSSINGAHLTSHGVQATTSGTTIDFTAIPSYVKRITIMFDAVSLSGSDQILVQIGDSGGFETSGYVSTSHDVSASNTSTAGFVVRLALSTRFLRGTMVLTKIDDDDWISSHSCFNTTTGAPAGGGTKTLSAGPLTQVRILATGANTFDSGQANILYE